MPSALALPAGLFQRGMLFGQSLHSIFSYAEASAKIMSEFWIIYVIPALRWFNFLFLGVAVV